MKLESSRQIFEKYSNIKVFYLPSDAQENFFKTNIKIYIKTAATCFGLITIIRERVILSVVLYGCETWSVTLREEYRLRIFVHRVLGNVFEPKRDEVLETVENGIMRNCMICTPNHIFR